MSDNTLVNDLTPPAEAPAAQAPDPTTTPEQEQRRRDERGRFTSAQPEAPAEGEAAPAETQPPVQEPPPTAEELEEIEWDGKQYKIPKPLKGGIMMQADYTRKTQELADQRRSVERTLQEAQQFIKASQEEVQAAAALHSIDAQIKEYSALNWDQFVNENPIEANKQWMRFQSLKDQRASIANEQAQRQSERLKLAETETVQRLQMTQEYVMKNVPGWTPEMDRQVIEFAKSQGATDQDIRNSMNPMVYNILRLARIGEQSLKTATASVKPAAAQVKPTSTVDARVNPSAGKSLADMDMDEYAAYRAKQDAAAA